MLSSTGGNLKVSNANTKRVWWIGEPVLGITVYVDVAQKKLHCLYGLGHWNQAALVIEITFVTSAS